MTREYFSQSLQIYTNCRLGYTFWGEPIFQNVWIIWFSLPYLNFKSLLDPNFSSFIRFQCILHDSGVPFPESSNFDKLKRSDPVSGGNQIWRNSELFIPTFCILILKVLRTEIFHHPLDFNAFSMIQEYFSQSLEISAN